MRVLHLISQRPDSTGSGIYLQSIMQQATRAGHENFLVAGVPAGNLPELDSIPRQNCRYMYFESTDYPERIVGMSDVMPYPSRQFRSLDETQIQAYLDHFRRTVLEAVELFRPDIIHVHHLWLLASLVRQLFPELTLVASSHGSDLRQFSQCGHLRDRVLAGCRNLDGVCALSSEQRHEIHDLYDIPLARIQVTGAGFDETLFHPPASPPQGPPTLLYGGKLSRAKGVAWLLQALYNLRTNDFHIHLAGGGAGPEFEECISWYNHLQDKATYHGAVTQQKLAELMRTSHCFVLPSLHEGLPLVILEALACGCSVISTDLPGTREIITQLVSAPIKLVEKPVVTDIDTSMIEAEPDFITRLESVLHDQLTQNRSEPVQHLSLDHFTWRQVFNRVETVWRTCASARS